MRDSRSASRTPMRHPGRRPQNLAPVGAGVSPEARLLKSRISGGIRHTRARACGTVACVPTQPWQTLASDEVRAAGPATDSRSHSPGEATVRHRAHETPGARPGRARRQRRTRARSFANGGVACRIHTAVATSLTPSETDASTDATARPRSALVLAYGAEHVPRIGAASHAELDSHGRLGAGHVRERAFSDVSLGCGRAVRRARSPIGTQPHESWNECAAGDGLSAYLDRPFVATALCGSASGVGLTGRTESG
jgi:hypothetical protein